MGSDNEDDEYVKHAEAIREKRSKAGKPESVQVTRQVPHDYWEEENQRLEKLKRARLKQVREEEELQKAKLREAEEKRRIQREEREAADSIRREHEYIKRERRGVRSLHSTNNCYLCFHTSTSTSTSSSGQPVVVSTGGMTYLHMVKLISHSVQGG